MCEASALNCANATLTDFTTFITQNCPERDAFETVDLVVYDHLRNMICSNLGQH